MQQLQIMSIGLGAFDVKKFHMCKDYIIGKQYRKSFPKDGGSKTSTFWA
jgi:hypothetical protein